MPSRTSSPLLHLQSPATFSSKLDCISFVKPFTSDSEYITNYINQHSSIPSHLSISPSQDTEKPLSKKRVSFADSVGLDLVHIRHMTAGRDTPPNLDPEIFASLNISKEKSVPTLRLGFRQPVSDYNHFRESLELLNVALESVSINDNFLIGTIKVKNLDFHKTVILRITYDNWTSAETVSAYYVNNGLTTTVKGNGISSLVDTFSFTHEVPVDRLTRNGIQFAVCFRCDGKEFWDNNESKNYSISVEGNKQYSADNTNSWLKNSRESNWAEFAIWRNLESDYTPYW